MKSFRSFTKDLVESLMTPSLDQIYLTEDGQSWQTLQEGKWIAGRFDRNIRLDQPTHLHGVGQQHGHVYGRNRNELVIVNFDGTGSHGTKGKLHQKDADALRARGFTIRPDNMVEWTTVGSMPTLLLG